MRSRPGKVRPKTDPVELRAAGVLLAETCGDAPLDMAAVFGNGRPVEIEIGPGKGTFLLRRAAERPEVNVLGVEWAPSYAVYVADRAYRAGLENIRVLCADAKDLFRTALPDRSVWRVHIYFPDPWPKRRHRFRRLIEAGFLREVRRALQLGGWLGIVTDQEEYFREIRRIVLATEGLGEAPFPPGEGASAVGSNFEKKYASQGKAFHAIAAIRLR